MLLTLLLILLLPFLYLLLSSIWNIVRNYSAARQIGIPIVTLWVSIDNPFWMLFSKYIRPFLNLLPFYSRLFSRFDHLGWEYEQRRTVHRDGEMGLGDAFVMVTPTQNSIYLCDAEAAVDIFHVERQQAGLERPTEMLETLGVFGPCIFTVSGWQGSLITSHSFQCISKQPARSVCFWLIGGTSLRRTI